MHADITDPALCKVIRGIVRRQTRHMPRTEATEVQKDLTQELLLKALQLQASYRGDNGASFATFAYRALALHAYHVLQRYESPVKAGKNNRDVWKMQRERPTNETPDALAVVTSPERAVDDVLAEASVGAHLRRLARQHADAAAIEAVVFDGASCETAGARTGRSEWTVRQAVSAYRAAVANDQTLRELYGTR